MRLRLAQTSGRLSAPALAMNFGFWNFYSVYNQNRMLTRNVVPWETTSPIPCGI